MAEYLVKFAARSGAASRRGAEDLIRGGRIAVNGVPETDPARKIDPLRDTVSCDGKILHAPEEQEKVYILLHKPRGYTTSHHDVHAEKLAVSLIDLPVAGKLVSAGRLDRESEGLLIFSNDGDFIHLLTHPRYGLKKRYRVTADQPLTEAGLRRIAAGITDRGERLKADQIVPDKTPGVYLITLQEGKKREIRRLLKACGAATLRLERLALGPVELGSLAPGRWRKLTSREVAELRNAALPRAAEKAVTSGGPASRRRE